VSWLSRIGRICWTVIGSSVPANFKNCRHRVTTNCSSLHDAEWMQTRSLSLGWRPTQYTESCRDQCHVRPAGILFRANGSRSSRSFRPTCRLPQKSVSFIVRMPGHYLASQSARPPSIHAIKLLLTGTPGSPAGLRNFCNWFQSAFRRIAPDQTEQLQFKVLYLYFLIMPDNLTAVGYPTTAIIIF